MRNFIIIIVAFLYSLTSCNKEKEISFSPTLPVDDIIVKYLHNSIVIHEGKGRTWQFYYKNGEYYIKINGNLTLFLSSAREIDKTYEDDGSLIKRVIVQKLNDSLFVSALHSIAIKETLEIELVYNRNYEVKQVRKQALWTDYVPKGNSEINYKPIYIEKPLHEPCPDKISFE